MMKRQQVAALGEEQVEERNKLLAEIDEQKALTRQL